MTGETDTTPVGAMGKVTQLTFGALSPGNVNVNLMSANITAGAASGAPICSTDLKSGYLLGANPRKQFIAQFAGIFIGTLVTVLSPSRLLVPERQRARHRPVPGARGPDLARPWRSRSARASPRSSPSRCGRSWPAASSASCSRSLPVLLPKQRDSSRRRPAFGLAWTFHWYYGLLFFLGALVALLLERKKKQIAEEFTFPVASGVVAGGSLMGVALVLWANAGSILANLLRH